MTVDNALSAMASIDALENGTAERAAVVAELHLKLLQDPEGFFDCFFETLEGLRDDPMRLLCERLMREGKTTFHDLKIALAQYNAAPKQTEQ